MAVRVFHRDKAGARLPMISRDARLVVWPGVGAQTANMNYVVMEPGETNVPHSHQDSEDTLYVLSGKGTVADLTKELRLPFEAGQVVHLPVGVRHSVNADRGSRIESVGGPCPADLSLLRSLGVPLSSERPEAALRKRGR